VPDAPIHPAIQRVIDAALRKGAAGRQFSFLEPRTLRGRVGLRAQPYVEMRRLNVERLHRLARG
jgi:hypothetical protein